MQPDQEEKQFHKEAMCHEMAQRDAKKAILPVRRCRYHALCYANVISSMQDSFVGVDEPVQRVFHRSLKLWCSLIVPVALLLSGCGGSSEAPTVPPVAVAPRVWSAPTAGPIAFQYGNLRAAPDACGGITLFGVHENIWKRQRYSPTTGWEPFAQPLFGSELTASVDVQVIDTPTAPNVFFMYERHWHQHAYRCEKDQWWGTNPLLIQYFAGTSNLTPPIQVRFSRTFDNQILAASVLPDRSAITLQQLFTEIWDQTFMYAADTVILDQGISATVPTPTTVTEASAARTANGDAALISTPLGKVAAFRPARSTTFTRLSEPASCFGRGCTFVSTFEAPTLEADGTATVFKSGAFPDVLPNWFRFSPTGLQPVVALSSLYSPPIRPAFRALRPDGLAIWLISNLLQSESRIVENGVTASWSGTSGGEATEQNDPSLNAFSVPDGDSLVTLHLGLVTTSLQPRLSISHRIGHAAWARDVTVDLGALLARYPNATAQGHQVVTYRNLTDRAWIVGSLQISDTMGALTYQPFLLWR